MYNDLVLDDILKLSADKLNGVINGVPFPYDRFKHYVPTLEKGVYSAILGSSGIGKSTLARELYVYHVLQFAHQYNYPVKIVYFALEDDKLKIMKKMFMYYAYSIFGVELSFWDINSKVKPLTPKEIEVLRKVNKFIAPLMDSIKIIDTVTTPNGMRNACDKMEEVGFFKDRHVFVICDNFMNITPDECDGDQWAAQSRFSSQIVRLDFCKKRGYSFIGILQTDMEQEKHSFRTVGKQSSIASLEPSTASIAGNKGMVRDFHLLFGIFNPARYEITGYPKADDYDITQLRNHFRSVLLLKSNDGELPYGRLGLRFHGVPGHFEELPPASEKDKLNLIYQDIYERELLRIEKSAVQKNIFGK